MKFVPKFISNFVCFSISTDVSKDIFTFVMGIALFSETSQKELFGCGIPPEFTKIRTLVVGHCLSSLGDLYECHTFLLGELLFHLQYEVLN